MPQRGWSRQQRQVDCAMTMDNGQLLLDVGLLLGGAVFVKEVKEAHCSVDVCNSRFVT